MGEPFLGKEKPNQEGRFTVKKRFKSLYARIKGQGGFSLLELIIVIAIMGFLTAMIAPRLAGMGGESATAVSDQNQMRLRQVLGAYTQERDALPDNLTNLVIQTAADGAGGALPGFVGFADPQAAGVNFFDNKDREDGKEPVSAEVDASVRLHLHSLSAEEAAAIRELGISHVFNLNLAYNRVDGYNDNAPDAHADAPFMERVAVAEGLPVLMVGAGFDGTAWDYELAADDEYIKPELAYRIVLGVGPDSGLVTDGLIQAAGLCPVAMQRGEHFVYSNYMMVLPRLEATVAATGARALPDDSIAVEHHITGQTKTIELAEAQDLWQVTTICPEGCPAVLGDPDPKWIIQP